MVDYTVNAAVTAAANGLTSAVAHLYQQINHQPLETVRRYFLDAFQQVIRKFGLQSLNALLQLFLGCNVGVGFKLDMTSREEWPY